MASDELLTEKKYFSITEVSQICNIKSHTLRFWEKEFEELKPLTRKGNRRYYQKEDIELIKRIQSLLYDSGMTISGAKKNLNFRNNLLTLYKNLTRIELIWILPVRFILDGVAGISFLIKKNKIIISKQRKKKILTL